MDPGASLARRCIAATLDVEVDVWDRPPRSGAFDLRYEWNSKTVAVEVKQDVDPAYQAAEAEVTKLGYTRDDRLRLVWDVRLSHTANWKRVSNLAPRILERLEALKWPNAVSLWRLRYVDLELLEQMEELEIQSVWSHPPTDLHWPGFYLMPEGWSGGIPTLDGLNAIIPEVLEKPHMRKLRKQLEEVTVDERHAFIVFGWEKVEAYCLMDSENPLPAEVPELPRPLDGIWLTTTARSSRVVAWLPGRGWIEGTAPE